MEMPNKIIATSSNDSIIGYRIIRQIETIMSSNTNEDEAKRNLKVKAIELGANGVINMRIAFSGNGCVNLQGDAVIIQEEGDDEKEEGDDEVLISQAIIDEAVEKSKKHHSFFPLFLALIISGLIFLGVLPGWCGFIVISLWACSLCHQN